MRRCAKEIERSSFAAAMEKENAHATEAKATTQLVVLNTCQMDMVSDMPLGSLIFHLARMCLQNGRCTPIHHPRLRLALQAISPGCGTAGQRDTLPSAVEVYAGFTSVVKLTSKSTGEQILPRCLIGAWLDPVDPDSATVGMLDDTLWLVRLHATPRIIVDTRAEGVKRGKFQRPELLRLNMPSAHVLGTSHSCPIS